MWWDLTYHSDEDTTRGVKTVFSLIIAVMIKVIITIHYNIA